MHTSPGGPISAQQFTDQTADETLGPWIDVRGKSHIVFYVTGEGTISSGVITFEEAAPKNMSVTGSDVAGEATGAYSSVTTYSASGATGGAQAAVHLPIAAYYKVRARISTAIVGGGDVSCGLVAY